MINEIIKAILLFIIGSGAVALMLICTTLIIDIFRRIGGKR